MDLGLLGAWWCGGACGRYSQASQVQSDPGIYCLRDSDQGLDTFRVQFSSIKIDTTVTPLGGGVLGKIE